MLKRIAEQSEERKSTKSPQKKATFQAHLTPKKEYPCNITVRKIIDPESNDLLAVTFENTYPILYWIKGEEAIDDLYIAAQGKLNTNFDNYTKYKCIF